MPIPPSGVVAALTIATDAAIGPWEASYDTPIAGSRPSPAVSNKDAARFLPLNAIVEQPRSGTRSLGARTLDTTTTDGSKYMPVIRSRQRARRDLRAMVNDESCGRSEERAGHDAGGASGRGHLLGRDVEKGRPAFAARRQRAPIVYGYRDWRRRSRSRRRGGARSASSRSRARASLAEGV